MPVPGNIPSNDQFCWHDPIYNRTSMRSDLEVDNITLDQVRFNSDQNKQLQMNGRNFILY